MNYFLLQQIINGLTLGAIYGLIAIGYTMVYGIIGMINFAHGDIFMIGAFVSLIGFLLLGVLGVSYIPLAFVLVLLTAMVFTGIYGWAIERIAYRPLRGSTRLAPLISAIGMSIVLENYVQLTQGARVKPLQPVIHGGFTIARSADFTVTVSTPSSPLSRLPSLSQLCPESSSRTSTICSMLPTSKLSTTGELFCESRSGATASMPMPRLAKARQKTAKSATSFAAATASTASRASTNVGITGVAL